MRNNTTKAKPSYYNPALTHVMQDTRAIMAIVGANTDRLRQERGLSYAEMSRSIGCSAVMLYYICKGKRDYCSIALLSAIANYFGCTLLDWLRSPIPSPFEDKLG